MHTLPHAPQFLGSFCKLAHWLAQQERSVPHAGLQAPLPAVLVPETPPLPPTAALPAAPPAPAPPVPVTTAVPPHPLNAKVNIAAATIEPILSDILILASSVTALSMIDAVI